MFDGLAPFPARGASSRLVLDTLDPINRGLRGWWPLNEGGGLARDISPFQRHGTRTGGTLSEIAPPPVNDRAAALTSSRYVLVSNFKWPGGVGVSVSAWIKTGTNGNNFLFDVGTVFGEPNLFHAHTPYSDNVVYFRYGTYASGGLTTSYTSYLNLWTHIVFVNNGANFKGIYINGKLVASGTSVATPPGAITRLRISDGLWAGRVGHFRIYDRAITAREVSRIYRDPRAGAFDPAARVFFGPARSVGGVAATATPGPATLTLTGAAVSASAAATASPGAAAQALTGTAVAATAGAMASPGAAALTLSGAAVAASAGATVSPGAATLTITGRGVAATAGAYAIPGAATLTMAGRGVAATAAVLAEPGTASLVWQGYGVNRVASAAPASRTYTWPVETRAVTWPAQSRIVTWRGEDMPSQVFQLKPQHVDDDLMHALSFEGFGTGDDVASFSVTVPAEITQSTAASMSGQTVTVWLQGSAGTHRIIVAAVSVATQRATIEADITISDPA